MKRLLVLLSLLLATAVTAAETKPPCCRAVAPSAPLTDKSLYQLESVWTSDVGKRVKLGVLRGRPQVLALFFTQCEFACPIIVNDMKAIENALPASLRGEVDFLLVSLDTERDTAETLHAYRAKQHLSNTNWTLLCSTADDVRELAALLGVNYQKDSRGQFAHSNIITVLNAAGEIVHQQIGLNQKPADTVQALSKALISPASPARSETAPR